MKSLASRKDTNLYALGVDHDAQTVDLTVFDHDTGEAASLFLPPELAQQMAGAIVHHVQLLKGL